MILICNMKNRKDEFLGNLHSIFSSGYLEKGELTKIRNRLEFTNDQLFGRLVRQDDHIFFSRGRLGSGLDQRLKWILEYLCEYLSSG